MLLLVEDRHEAPEPRRRRAQGVRLPWRPFPPLVLMLVLLGVAPALDPLPGLGAAFGALASFFWLVARLTGSWDGLREHRQ